LGASGLEVGAIGLGCMGMSWAYANGAGEAESLRVVRRAVEAGATLVDTADVYGPFANEALVGRALRRHRGEAIVSTKCGLVGTVETGLGRNGRPEHVRAACEASLRRLGVDAIDVGARGAQRDPGPRGVARARGAARRRRDLLHEHGRRSGERLGDRRTPLPGGAAGDAPPPRGVSLGRLERGRSLSPLARAGRRR
jgi:hypothetical protein